MSTPTPTPTTTNTPGLCGNGTVDFDAGETCDDNNTDEGDSCPANCMIRTCTGAASGTLDVEVDFAAPEDISGITMFLRYPDGVVRIPGTGGQTQVLDSIVFAPDGAGITVNDREYGMNVVLIGSEAFPPPHLLTVQFQICPDATAPDASAFRCDVFSASNPQAQNVEGVTCSVRTP
jgi:hypothetical protein